MFIFFKLVNENCESVIKMVKKRKKIMRDSLSLNLEALNC